MILNLNKQAQDAFAAVDALGNTLKYGELLDFSDEHIYYSSQSFLIILIDRK